MRQIWPSRHVSACSFSTLRLNPVLTHGIAPDVHGGVHIFPHTYYDIVYVQNTKYSTTTAVLYGHELASTSNLSDSFVKIFLNTLRSKSTLVQSTGSRELHTHRTTVDAEKKSPTVITPRCPDNRRELRVHATTVVVVVVITYSRIQINRKVANPVHMIS